MAPPSAEGAWFLGREGYSEVNLNKEYKMSVIRVHLEPAESHVVDRLAHALKVSREDVAYAALDRLMTASQDPGLQNEIKETSQSRKNNLPLWADTERSVHAYEGGHDDQPEERLRFE